MPKEGTTSVSPGKKKEKKKTSKPAIQDEDEREQDEEVSVTLNGGSYNIDMEEAEEDADRVAVVTLKRSGRSSDSKKTKTDKHSSDKSSKHTSTKPKRKKQSSSEDEQESEDQESDDADDMKDDEGQDSEEEDNEVDADSDQELQFRPGLLQAMEDDKKRKEEGGNGGKVQAPDPLFKFRSYFSTLQKDGFVQISPKESEQAADFERLITDDDSEFWLIKAPKEFDITSLESVHLHPALLDVVGEVTEVLSKNKKKQKNRKDQDSDDEEEEEEDDEGETKRWSVVMADPKECQGLMNLFPVKDKDALVLGKPFARQLNIFEKIGSRSPDAAQRKQAPLPPAISSYSLPSSVDKLSASSILATVPLLTGAKSPALQVRYYPIGTVPKKNKKQVNTLLETLHPFHKEQDIRKRREEAEEALKQKRKKMKVEEGEEETALQNAKAPAKPSQNAVRMVQTPAKPPTQAKPPQHTPAKAGPTPLKPAFQTSAKSAQTPVKSGQIPPKSAQTLPKSTMNGVGIPLKAPAVTAKLPPKTPTPQSTPAKISTPTPLKTSQPKAISTATPTTTDSKKRKSEQVSPEQPLKKAKK